MLPLYLLVTKCVHVYIGAYRSLDFAESSQVFGYGEVIKFCVLPLAC